MIAQEVVNIVLGLAPRSGEIKGDENGLLYGDPNTKVTGIATTWTPSVKVLTQAAAENLNFVLTHEILWFPSSKLEWYATLAQEDRPHNIARRKILDQHRMVVCRCHSNWDPIEGEGIADSCARTLGFGAPIYRSRYLRMYEVAPQTLAQLADHCKARLAVPQVRVAGDLNRVVRKIGIAYGGFGQSWQCLDEFIVQRADAVIIGEAIDYTIRAAIDAGLGYIETTHVGSENPGMASFARLLKERLPGIPVRFIDAGHPWVYR